MCAPIARKKLIPWKDVVTNNLIVTQKKLVTIDINDTHNKWGN